MRVNVLERGSGSTRNMTNLLIGLEDHKLPWWCCSACGVRVPLPINIVDATYSHCSLLISLSNFRGWFWVPLFPRVQVRYQVCHLLSLESVENQGHLWCGWGTVLSEAAVQSDGAFQTALIWNAHMYYYDPVSPNNHSHHCHHSQWNDLVIFSYEMNIAE